MDDATKGETGSYVRGWHHGASAYTMRIQRIHVYTVRQRIQCKLTLYPVAPLYGIPSPLIAHHTIRACHKIVHLFFGKLSNAGKGG